eukprot:11210257-Lingulodinium_polyedra.AAC.1
MAPVDCSECGRRLHATRGHGGLWQPLHVRAGGAPSQGVRAKQEAKKLRPRGERRHPPEPHE